MRLRNLFGDALLSVARRPGRTLACAIGTTVAVAALVATNGLTQSARAAVSARFNALTGTTDYFQARGALITDAGVARLERLNGVRQAGLLWDVHGGQPAEVSSDFRDIGGPGASSLAFTAATPGALEAIGAHLASGQLYGPAADSRHEMVALLGAAAAKELGIKSAIGSPAIFVGHSALTVVGIISSATQEAQVLLGVVVPPYAASVVGGRSSERRVIVRTAQGAAQLIGRQAPLSLSPYHVSEVSAEVPPAPSSLRENVDRSIASLFTALLVAGFVIGVVSIACAMMLSVSERRSEIGLRRAIGFKRSQIATLVLCETVYIGGLGAALGTSVGVLATSALTGARGWAPVLSPTSLLGAPAMGLLISVLAGAYPAWLAARTTPVRALRQQ